VSVVLDSSMSLAWYFEDEVTEANDAVLDRVRSEGALVPALWHFEVANALQMAVTRNRVDATFRDRALSRLKRLDIRVDVDSLDQAWNASVALAHRHGLTVYDAAYLELAHRRGLPLATLDRALLRAGRADGVQVIGV
jgi:predicted nucleic acid-binding protein